MEEIKAPIEEVKEEPVQPKKPQKKGVNVAKWKARQLKVINDMPNKVKATAQIIEMFPETVNEADTFFG